MAGDTRATFSSMRTRLRDALWAAVAVGFAAAFAWGLIGLVADLVAAPGLATLARLAMGVLAVAVVGRWLVLGAWRRTKWGAPAGGVREFTERRLAGAGASADDRPSPGGPG